MLSIIYNNNNNTVCFISNNFNHSSFSHLSESKFTLCSFHFYFPYFSETQIILQMLNKCQKFHNKSMVPGPTIDYWPPKEIFIEVGRDSVREEVCHYRKIFITNNKAQKIQDRSSVSLSRRCRYSEMSLSRDSTV